MQRIWTKLNTNQPKSLTKEEEEAFMSKMNTSFLKVSLEILFSELLLKSHHLSASEFQFYSPLLSNEIVLIRVCGPS